MPPIDYAKPGEEQELWVKVIFTVKHNPGDESHLRQLLRSALTPKGIEVQEDGTIVM